MTWKDLVPACFGEKDRKLGVHELDAERTRAMVAAARAEGASREDVEKEIVWDCYKNVQAAELLKPHTDEQVRQLNKFWPL